MASVPQHVCNVPFMHITHQLMELSCTQWDPGTHTDSQPFVAYRSRIYASIFLTVFAKCTSEPQLNPRLRVAAKLADLRGLSLNSLSAA